MPLPLFRAGPALFAAAAADWRKVARVVSEVWGRLPSRWRTEASVRTLTRHLVKLVASGQLEAQGDIRRIGYSEVRLARRRGGSRPK